MRLVFVSDLHGDFDAVPRVLAELDRVDLVVVGGDITSGGSPAEASRAAEGWTPLAPRLLAVAGNWDSPEIDERLNELGVSLDGRGVILGEVGICGVSSSPLSAINSPYEREEAEIRRRLDRGYSEIEDCLLHIVCSHTPPLDTSCDRMFNGHHIGSRAVREFAEERQPELVLCGHVHEARSIDRIGATRIVNPGAARDGHYAIVEIEEERTGVMLDPNQEAGCGM